MCHYIISKDPLEQKIT